METNFKKARIITIAMIGAVIAYGVVAWILSNHRGYGASSEAKMNFMRTAVFIFAATQIALAAAVRKTIGAISKTTSSARLLSLQIMINVFCEIIALLGFVLSMVSKAFMDYAMFAFISLFAFALFFPRRKDWEAKSANEVVGG